MKISSTVPVPCKVRDARGWRRVFVQQDTEGSDGQRIPDGSSLIRQESFDHLNLPYLAGQKLVSILERLELYTEQVLCWKFSQEGENCRENQEFGEEVEQISFSFLEYLPSLREVLAQDVEASTSWARTSRNDGRYSKNEKLICSTSSPNS